MSSTRLETARRFIAIFTTLDTHVLHDILADDHTHQFAPTSLNPPGPFDKAGIISHISHLTEVMTGFPVTAKEYLDSESSNAVTVWATSEAHFREDVKDDGVSADVWAFRGEYVFMFFFDEEGKIKRTVEFLDSKRTADGLMVLMKRARENMQKRIVAGERPSSSM